MAASLPAARMHHRRMNRLPVIAAVFLATFAASAEEEPVHPLDAKVGRIIENATSTADMVEAHAKGLKLWDAELNRCYGELKKSLTPKGFAALQVAQRQWLAYRDAQIKYIQEFYGNFEGTMYIPMSAAAVMELTRHRAIQLYTQLELLNEQ